MAGTGRTERAAAEAFCSDAYFNAKYSAFYLVGNGKGSRPVQIGKPHPTVEAALRAANRRDARLGTLTFIDVVSPRTTRAALAKAAI